MTGEEGIIGVSLKIWSAGRIERDAGREVHEAKAIYLACGRKCLINP